MKNPICESFNIVSTNLGEQTTTYDTFSKKLSYFYQQHGTDKNLINCIYQISSELLSKLLFYMKENAEKYKVQTDDWGFSALYYYNLRPIPASDKQELVEVGFKEIYPTHYSVEHFNHYSYYFHNEGARSTAFVFLGEDNTGALDINPVHVLFTKGYNVIIVDARIENIHLKEVYNIVYQHSNEDISLIYIGSHGTKSSLREDMHTLPILGYSEEIKEIDIENPGQHKVMYVDDVINTATFLRGISYAIAGYNSWITSFLTKTPNFFFSGNAINVFLASCSGQIAVFDAKYSLPQGSQILILGEHQKINGVSHVYHVTNRDETRLLDSIASNSELTQINLKNFLDAYTFSATLDEKHTPGAPYYLKIIGHELWSTVITKEFSCLTVSEEKTKELIKMREEKNPEYIKLLASACNEGYDQPEPILENMWTKEYLYKNTKEMALLFYEGMSYYSNTLYDYIVGDNKEVSDNDFSRDL